MATSDAEVALDHLGRSTLFGVLSEDDRRAIVALMRPVGFSTGQLIFSRGDKGNGVYLVLGGRVRLSVLTADGREISLNHASDGAVFGEIAALDGGERSADATAISPVKTLVLSQAALVKLIGENQRVAMAAIRFLCARLRRNAVNLEAIALHSIEVRLARFLLSVIEERSSGLTQPSISFALGISQSEIGLLIGASRPKVNLAFAVLEGEGAIKRNGSEFRFSLGALRRCAAYDG